ncbi:MULTISPECIES: GlxA family transcriptional regulator [Mesorhizobium]|uniref:Helix-turn-helix-domain containing protein AraC type n=1 Tax=Mesorhizobium ciceri biovar biserrulae (strain HAMBI 2942 / LMG 23838 / WSM1271) TaxID=765698 RepID=E8TAT6_MESCW|nr:GlxA family transcriptional regulator [Mesorhizobium ciceri]ADV11966.1 helix-turn-helix- domain containing protein AraC type [Mesorhizobium ciceri biovar biserrulae WSM1271]
MRRHVAVVVHPGFQLLDAAGPTTVFEIAERCRPDSYELVLLSPGGGDVESSSGLKLLTRPLRDGPFDTVIVSGGEIIRSIEAMEEIVAWLRRVPARRTTSVCTGAYLLARAGLLDGRRATTHWASSHDFHRRYPKVRLDAERIFIRDGDIWTSAGISAGIDLALALVEDDLGAEVARRTAQQIVMHQRRPGGQSQFSAFVELGGRTGRFAALIEWVRANLAEPLTVECLADHAAMSPRNFARAFTSETGVTPAKAVERMRLETARTAIETSHLPLERIAEAAGFGDPGRMRRAFLRTLGQPPQAFRAAAEHRELQPGRPSSGSAGLRAVPVQKRTKPNERT